MTWPASDVSTTNLDNNGDNPALARADIKDMADKVNQVRNHVTSFGQSLIDDADAATARATLGSSVVGDAVFTAGTSNSARTSLGAGVTGDSLFTAATASDARTTLGLGTSATKNTGTSVGDVVEVQTGGKLPALDGSDLTNLPTGGASTSSNNTWTKAQRGSITALTDGTTITPDFNDNNFYSVTLGGNRTLANPTNIVAGQSGSIFITQDGTGSRTLAYGSYFKFPFGAVPTLTTTASAVDRLDYIVETTTRIHASLTKGVA